MEENSTNGYGITSYIRIRPPLARELELGESPAATAASDDSVTVACTPDALGQQQVYTFSDFDGVFDPSAAQSDVYSGAVRPVVEHVLAGFHGTVMAYGQTSAGKTFTLFGPSLVHPVYRGAAPRAVEDVFAALQARAAETPEFRARVSVSCVEIYMEQTHDLLAEGCPRIRVRADAEGALPLPDARAVRVDNAEEALSVMMLALQHRRQGASNANDVSSRSHCIFALTLAQCTGPDQPTFESTLCVVDLAGSENVSRTGSVGKRLTEAKVINASLLALGQVVAALATPRRAAHVPFRDSELTRILHQSLGGSALAVLLAAVAPALSSTDTTLSTLRFAARAQRVVNYPLRTVVASGALSRVQSVSPSPPPSPSTRLEQAQAEIARLQALVDRQAPAAAAAAAAAETAYVDRMATSYITDNDLVTQNAELQKRVTALTAALEAARAPAPAPSDYSSILNPMQPRTAADTDEAVYRAIPSLIEPATVARVGAPAASWVRQGLDAKQPTPGTDNPALAATHAAVQAETLGALLPTIAASASAAALGTEVRGALPPALTLLNAADLRGRTALHVAAAQPPERVEAAVRAVLSGVREACSQASFSEEEWASAMPSAQATDAAGRTPFCTAVHAGTSDAGSEVLAGLGVDAGDVVAGALHVIRRGGKGLCGRWARLLRRAAAAGPAQVLRAALMTHDIDLVTTLVDLIEEECEEELAATALADAAASAAIDVATATSSPVASGGMGVLALVLARLTLPALETVVRPALRCTVPGPGAQAFVPAAVAALVGARVRDAPDTPHPALHWAVELPREIFSAALAGASLAVPEGVTFWTEAVNGETLADHIATLAAAGLLDDVEAEARLKTVLEAGTAVGATVRELSPRGIATAATANCPAVLAAFLHAVSVQFGETAASAVATRAATIARSVHAAEALRIAYDYGASTSSA